MISDVIGVAQYISKKSKLAPAMCSEAFPGIFVYGNERSLNIIPTVTVFEHAKLKVFLKKHASPC